MSNFIVVPNRKESINNILTKDIKGIILGVKDLSIYELELDIDTIIDISNNTSKKVIVAINKMIHNSDLELVRKVLLKVKESNISGILFYDLGVFNLIKQLDIKLELIISQEHLNASINSNLFYYKKGINSSFITSDITFDEVLDIKNNTKMNIYYTVYGYLPIFYSRRMLLTNYFKYINKNMSDDEYYIFNKDLKHLIKENNYGTVIYSPLINLINEVDSLNSIDNLVIDLSHTKSDSVLDNFINNKREDSNYIGFFNTKTIYKLKGDKDE